MKSMIGHFLLSCLAKEMLFPGCLLNIQVFLPGLLKERDTYLVFYMEVYGANQLL